MSSALTPQSRIVASKNQVSTNLSGEVVILGMHDSTYYGLDPIGARIWALVQEPRSLSSIVETITDEYDVTAERAMADLVVLADSLIARGLLEIATAPAA